MVIPKRIVEKEDDGWGGVSSFTPYEVRDSCGWGGSPDYVDEEDDFSDGWGGAPSNTYHGWEED